MVTAKPSRGKREASNDDASQACRTHSACDSLEAVASSVQPQRANLECRLESILQSVVAVVH